ncbi:hypothetical protein Bca4012_085130 [Brassica carinata]
MAALPSPLKFACSVSGTPSPSVCDQLLMFWEARNMKSGGNHIGVDLLLLDAKVIPVTLI